MNRIRQHYTNQRQSSVTLKNRGRRLPQTRLMTRTIGRFIKVLNFPLPLRRLTGPNRLIKTVIRSTTSLLMTPVHHGAMLNLLIRLLNTSLRLSKFTLQSSRHHIRQTMRTMPQANSMILRAAQRQIPLHIRRTRGTMTILGQIRRSPSSRRVMSIDRITSSRSRLLMRTMMILQSTISLHLSPIKLRLIISRNRGLPRMLITQQHPLSSRASSLIMRLKRRHHRNRIFRFPLSNIRTRPINRQYMGLRHLTQLLLLLILQRPPSNTRIIRSINRFSSRRPSVTNRHRSRLTRHLDH